LQQTRARAAHRGRLKRGGEGLAQALDRLEMGVGKTVLAIAHQAHALDRAVAILERHSQIVGASGRGHLVQHLMVALPEVQQPAAEALAPLDHVLEGAAIVGTGGERAPGHHILMGVGAIPRPDAPQALARGLASRWPARRRHSGTPTSWWQKPSIDSSGARESCARRSASG
jgi:hypothetical protein